MRKFSRITAHCRGSAKPEQAPRSFMLIRNQYIILKLFGGNNKILLDIHLKLRIFIYRIEKLFQ